MDDSERFKLRFGPYETPLFNYGDVVLDEVRGEVRVTALSAGRIPWPIGLGIRGRGKSLVVYGALVDAVRRKSNQAICHWWGLTGQTVRKWRKALDVDANNEGTLALRQAHGREDWFRDAQAKAHAKAQDPIRREKIRASRLGKPRPLRVIEALRRANLGKKASEETRRKLSQAHKKRGTRPPKAGSAWTPEEDELVRKLNVVNAVNATGRTKAAVKCRRQKLGIGMRNKLATE